MTFIYTIFLYSRIEPEGYYIEISTVWTYYFCVTVPAARLELGLALQGGPVPVQGVPHLPLPYHQNTFSKSAHFFLRG
jgi:hypothetical protein